MKTYRISSSGRRTALILLVGALIIWVFALWTFGCTLGISYNPLAVLGVAARCHPGRSRQGLSISQIVPALLMLVLIVATPLVIWNIWRSGPLPIPPPRMGCASPRSASR